MERKSWLIENAARKNRRERNFRATNLNDTTSIVGVNLITLISTMSDWLRLISSQAILMCLCDLIKQALNLMMGRLKVAGTGEIM